MNPYSDFHFQFPIENGIHQKSWHPRINGKSGHSLKSFGIWSLWNEFQISFGLFSSASWISNGSPNSCMIEVNLHFNESRFLATSMTTPEWIFISIAATSKLTTTFSFLSPMRSPMHKDVLSNFLKSGTMKAKSRRDSTATYKFITILLQHLKNLPLYGLFFLWQDRH